MQTFPELGFYALPGHAVEPQQIFDDIPAGDSLGFGSVWISERLNNKELGVLSGISLAKSPNMAVAASLIANLPARNPVLTAAYASTMMVLSDNRFALGVGRGFNSLADSLGLPHMNFALFADYFDILRRLWRGEAVDYQGPAGTLSGAKLGMELEVIPPIIMAAMGPKTLYWAGQHADGVLLQPLWSTEGVAASIEIIQRGARDAGRDPASVKIWPIVVTASDVDEEKQLDYVVRRMSTYAVLPHILESVCAINGWVLDEVLPVRQAILDDMDQAKTGSMGDEGVTREHDQLRRIRDLWPEKWLYEGNAIGSAEECARRLKAYFNAGADGIVLHGSRPQDLASLLKIWPQYRDAERLAGRSVNPGL